jgi:hypothetical protein
MFPAFVCCVDYQLYMQIREFSKYFAYVAFYTTLPTIPPFLPAIAFMLGYSSSGDPTFQETFFSGKWHEL